MTSHLYFGSTTWANKRQLRQRIIGQFGGSHLEQADTGLDTRNKGLSEKLDRGITPAQKGNERRVKGYRRTATGLTRGGKAMQSVISAGAGRNHGLLQRRAFVLRVPRCSLSRGRGESLSKANRRLVCLRPSLFVSRMPSSSSSFELPRAIDLSSSCLGVLALLLLDRCASVSNDSRFLLRRQANGLRLTEAGSDRSIGCDEPPVKRSSRS